MNRAAHPSLPRFWQQVANAPHAYDLYALLRWLDARAGAPARLGHATHPGDEPLRIGQQPSLVFAPAALASATPPKEGVPPRLSIHGFGLFGPNGPLPLHLTEYARDRARNHDDPALMAFADLFHHRLALLFYRAWADAQATVSLDRGAGARFDAYVASLIHLGLPSQTRRGDLPPHACHFMAGHLVRQIRNPAGLQQILEAYLGVPVTIVEFVPHWIPVEASQCTRLRGSMATRRLGSGALLGVAVRDVQSKFEIRLGPLTRAQFFALLPRTKQARQLVQWVRLYAGVEWAWDLRLILAADQASGAKLGSNSPPLGWGSWLGTCAYVSADANAPTNTNFTANTTDFVYQPELYEYEHEPEPEAA
jgi:type VI secretion system protein ImpH